MKRFKWWLMTTIYAITNRKKFNQRLDELDAGQVKYLSGGKK